MDQFDVYKIIKVVIPDLSTAGQFNKVDRIRATPLVEGTRVGKKDVQSHSDTVLVHD
jgi:hypothetical protein